jgi:hypothetical protein
MNQQGLYIQFNKKVYHSVMKTEGPDDGILIPKHVAQGKHKQERKTLLRTDCVNIIKR